MSQFDHRKQETSPRARRAAIARRALRATKRIADPVVWIAGFVTTIAVLVGTSVIATGVAAALLGALLLSWVLAGTRAVLAAGLSAGVLLMLPSLSAWVSLDPLDPRTGPRMAQPPDTEKDRHAAGRRDGSRKSKAGGRGSRKLARSGHGSGSDEPAPFDAAAADLDAGGDAPIPDSAGPVGNDPCGCPPDTGGQEPRQRSAPKDKAVSTPVESDPAPSESPMNCETTVTRNQESSGSPESGTWSSSESTSESTICSS